MRSTGRALSRALCVILYCLYCILNEIEPYNNNKHIERTAAHTDTRPLQNTQRYISKMIGAVATH